MLNSLLLLALISTAFANPTPPPSPTPDPVAEKFARLEATLFPEVEIVRCRTGRAPCIGNDARYGCVDESLAPDAFKRACDEYTKAIERQFPFACNVMSEGKEVFLGMVSDSEACDILTIAWREFEKDLRYTGFSTSMKVAKLRTILKPNGKKGTSIFGSDMRFKKNGKAKRERLNPRLIERAMRERMREYDEEATCGPGIIKGIDRVPVLNQNRQGTCYSHVAASMTDFLRITRYKSEYPEFSSPLMMAIDYKVNTDGIETCTSPADSGMICSTFSRAMNKGFCSTEQIEKAIENSLSPAISEINKSDHWYQKWGNQLIEGPEFSLDLIKKDGEFPSQSRLDQKKLDMKRDAVVKFIYLLGQAYQKQDFAKIRKLYLIVKRAGAEPGESCSISTNSEDPKLLAIVLAKDLGSFYKVFFESLCVRTPYPYRSHCVEKDGIPTQADVDETLEKGMPVGINYCANILEHPDYSGSIDAKDCEKHVSMIVGTARDQNGKCTYVVRNSWGTNCGRNVYHKDYTCRDGNIYIPKEALLKNVFFSTRIKSDSRTH